MTKSPKPKEFKPPPKVLWWYVRICEILDKNPSASLQDIADLLDCSLGTVKNTVKEVKASFPEFVLFESVEKKKGTTILAAGRQLWREVEALLSRYDSLLKESRESVVRIGTSNAIMVIMLPYALRRYVRKKHGRSEIDFLEGDFHQLVKAVSEEEVAIAFGPHITQTPFVNVDIEPLADLDIVALCPKGHPWEKKNTPVALKDFSEERTFVLASSEQPDVFDKIRTNPARNGERITVQNYTSIFAAISMGIGVSVIPALPSFKVPTGVRILKTRGFAPAKIAAYMPKGGRNALTNEAKILLEYFELWLGKQQES